MTVSSLQPVACAALQLDAAKVSSRPNTDSWPLTHARSVAPATGLETMTNLCPTMSEPAGPADVHDDVQRSRIAEVQSISGRAVQFESRKYLAPESQQYPRYLGELAPGKRSDFRPPTNAERLATYQYKAALSGKVRFFSTWTKKRDR